jgi:L-gulonolactone oxidase
MTAVGVDVAVESWGRTVRRIRPVSAPADLAQAVRSVTGLRTSKWLPRGLGRSYGDVALASDGVLIDSRHLDKVMSFDRDTGLLKAEGGVSLDTIVRLALPHGWFLPTTPGTRHVTLGGAVANDVHGKNHHRAGTFGCAVLDLELIRSDAGQLSCSPSAERALFAATIGGLGLTGFIATVTLQLVRVPGAYLTVRDRSFGNLDEFFDMMEVTDINRAEHIVAWLDCVGKKAGRGILSTADWVESPYDPGPKATRFTLPFGPPFCPVNGFTTALFNEIYFRARARASAPIRQHCEHFFYPLDAVGRWNLLYGPRGFYQYQCVVPRAAQRQGLAALLREIARSNLASFLVVLKIFGDRASPGLLSYPMAGTNLALDFPNRGAPLHRLFERLDAIVSELGGRINPAKDMRMPGALFRRGYPNWERLRALKDPAVGSDFWSRVTAQEP